MTTDENFDRSRPAYLRTYVREPMELLPMMGNATVVDAWTLWMLLCEFALLDPVTGILEDLECHRWGKLVAIAKNMNDLEMDDDN